MAALSPSVLAGFSACLESVSAGFSAGFSAGLVSDAGGAASDCPVGFAPFVAVAGVTPSLLGAASVAGASFPVLSDPTAPSVSVGDTVAVSPDFGPAPASAAGAAAVAAGAAGVSLPAAAAFSGVLSTALSAILPLH